MRTPSLLLVLLLAVAALAAKVPEPASLAAKYVFTDEHAVIRLLDAVAEVPYALRTITAAGWGPTAEGKAAVAEGAITLAPLCEGMHIVTLGLAKPVEVRFLAFTPPPRIKRAALLRALPLNGKKLLEGKPFLGVAMGDSVTNAGDYEGLLAKMLTRATGNPNVKIIDRSYPGRSVDAAVRFFPDDVLATKPDVGFLMYGLNDLHAGCSLEGYLDQYAWIADHLRADVHADPVFLTPTPDASMDEKFTAYGTYLIETLRFADALAPLAQARKVPLADTFHALWAGGDSLDAAGRKLWAKFPQGYDRQFTSILETQRGDGIHPNVLGHLAIARAVYAAMTGQPATAPPLAFTAVSHFTPDGLVSTVTVRNASKAPRTGTLNLCPLPDGAVTTEFHGIYSLIPGATQSFTVRWPGVKSPDNLLVYPNNSYIATGRPTFAVLDTSGEIYAVAAPFAVAGGFRRERQLVTGNTVTVTLDTPQGATTQTVTLPEGREMGRIPLRAELVSGKATTPAVAELVYLRCAGALRGEATVDGALTEWDAHAWSTLGDPEQARWTQGHQDHRATPQECTQQWAFKAGEKGLFCAVKLTDATAKDSFTLFFDPRDPAELGTPGRYYWASGDFRKDGTLGMSRGETSKSDAGLKGAYRAAADGMTMELFIPYALMERDAWPAGGQLGFSIWWRHNGPAGTTHLLWSDDGHPWNTRWYGVVCLQADKAQPLPYRVRIK
jgi:lysophospholipase L1-like esterase